MGLGISLAAIKAFWLTTVICLLLLPLVVLPLAGSMFVMVDHPPGTAMAALALLVGEAKKVTVTIFPSRENGDCHFFPDSITSPRTS